MVKNPPANAGDTGSIPGLGRSAEEENGNTLQSSCLGNPMDRGAWWGWGDFSPRGPRRVRHDLATEQQQPVPSTLFSLLHALPVSLGTRCHFHTQPSPTHHGGNKQRESSRPPPVRVLALLRLPPPPPSPRALPSSAGVAQGLAFLLCLPCSFAMSLCHCLDASIAHGPHPLKARDTSGENIKGTTRIGCDKYSPGISRKGTRPAVRTGEMQGTGKPTAWNGKPRGWAWLEGVRSWGTGVSHTLTIKELDPR